VGSCHIIATPAKDENRPETAGGGFSTTSGFRLPASILDWLSLTSVFIF
jgi:hypothetical protein